MVFRRGLMVLAAASAGLLAAEPARAEYPSKVVTIVVPFPPGGGTDTGTRLLAQRLSQHWGGKTVVVENKPGGAGIIGAEHVSRANADGHTLLMGNVGTQSINPSLYKKLSYDADKAFLPGALVAELPLVLLLNPRVPANSPKELIALAKSKPGGLSYASSGTGGAPHLSAALFEKLAGVELLHVPYKGGGPAMQDLVGGHVDLLFATILESISAVKSGKVRALAVTSDARSPALPEVPTLDESALPGYNSASWIGLLAPAGTPQPLVDQLAKSVRDILGGEELRQRLIDQGATPAAALPPSFRPGSTPTGSGSRG